MAQLYLVQFKGSRREYFRNTYHHTLNRNDQVVTQADQGEDLGFVSGQIDRDLLPVDSPKPRSILRRASDDDLARFQQLTLQEKTYKKEIIQLVGKHGLTMKVVDVECQFDGNKITFFFTADHRVDFRALVRDLASRYRTRIELRQIGVRDEARRIDGYGICGRRQCCNSHIKQFVPISTQHAREQDLPLNPAKISGNCGRLLCCLRYETDLYTTVKAKFPKIGTRVRTSEGDGVLERIDVFGERALIRAEDRTHFHVSAEEIGGKAATTKTATLAEPDKSDLAEDEVIEDDER
ncbi:MAG: regulatory iron-sulfur-containing complex subunit RicT [candidate division Zixibacteria bacterium]